MRKSLIESFISNKRFSSYESIEEYKQNLQFSKYSYIPLSILEISLRNAIDQHFSRKIGKEWYEDESFLTKDSIFKVRQAKELLQRRRESTSKDKIIAELSLGFWVNLFKKPYDKKLRINDLKNIFPNHPSRNVKLVNRDTLYKKLNHIRNFRNRVFHYEKVLNKDNYNTIFSEIDEILRYFDDEIYIFAYKINFTESPKSLGDI